MKRAALAVAALTLTACASGPTPMMMNGRYYMAGDAVCVRYTVMSPTRIMCHDENGVAQGWRDAIPHETMQVYVQQQAIAQQQLRDLGTRLTATANEIARQNQESAAAYNAATRALPTTVQPIGPQETQTICLVNGRYVSCRTRPQ
jgi:hypothetical protein